MAAKASVKLSGRFPAGAKVGLYARHGDYLQPGSAALKSATVSKLGEAEFKALEPGTYFVGGDVDGTFRSVAVTAKEQPAAKKRQSAAEIRDRLAQTRPPVDDRTQRVTGARGSDNIKATGRGGQPFVAANAGVPLGRSEGSVEVHPHVRQEDVKGPQRSDTITGQGTPVDPKEPQPSLRQDQVGKGVQQRSATPHGEATPIPAAELGQPANRQEDVSAATRQRSATITGAAEPLPADAQPAKRKPARSKKKSTSRAKARPRSRSARKKK